MAVPGLSSLLTEVETAVGASRSDAVDAAVKAFRAKAPPLEVIRAAARAGDVAEAESIFLGMVDEGWERKMAGDMLFRAALEDMGEGGRKLFFAVKLWQLARSLGFKEARTILRPAVEYLVRGPRDRSSFETILGLLGKEWVDLDALSSGGRALDDAGRSRVTAIASAPSDPACIGQRLPILQDGYAASSIAEGLVVAAARRVLGAKGYDTEAIKRLLFAHASRFVLMFSRTSERLYALFQSALRVRSPEPSVIADVDRDPAQRNLDRLANDACRDSPSVNEGFNLLLADACTTEFRATQAAPVVMALVKMMDAGPKDLAAFHSWADR